MKRLAVLGFTAFLAVAHNARAQLTMQMSNGWNFTFAGNVNAFYVEQWGNALANAGPGGAPVINGGLVAQGEGTNANIRTGLLPAAVTFDAKGKEGDLLLGVHFGFFPQIQNGGDGRLTGQSGNIHDQFGAQIDMRQVYLTVGGDWGQILAGREIGLYQRQNILTDATLFGIGASGGNLGAGGTTLGRIGFGYVYPNFEAQITYSTSATSPLQFAIGVFQPSEVGAAGTAYVYTPLPRVESEISYTGKLGQAEGTTNKWMVWVNGMVQQAQNAPTGTTPSGAPDTTTKVTSAGVGGGLKLDFSRLSLVGSGYYGRGIGTVLMFGGTAIDANPAGAQGRIGYGYIGQASFKLDPKWTLVGSWGESMTTGTNFDNANFATQDGPLLKYNALGVGSLVYQMTKSLKWVIEYDYTEAANQAHQKQVANQVATGFMVFF